MAGGVLVLGEAGAGKTTALRAAAAGLARRGVHVESVALGAAWAEPVREGGGRPGRSKVTSGLERVAEAARRAVERWPAVLLVDDIEQVAPSEQGEASRVGRAEAALLVDLLRSLRAAGSAAGPVPPSWEAAPPAVAVVCTARAVEGVWAGLLRGGLLDLHVALPPLSAEARVDLLRRMLNAGPLPAQGACAERLARRLESFSGRDLDTLARRALVAAAARLCADPGAAARLEGADLEAARAGFTPVALQGMDRSAGGAAAWDDIGGLAEQKQALLDTVLLPTKFPAVFAAAPLRVRSGVLLYGPPGCGKTLLAGALAGRCGLGFIGVKGPELLNKYIGASEQGVRDVFRRARGASPCILFLDEFDSIAPQRGHDSTGVTDRVVNQLLTALDGVEGLAGVFVVAATSRPDLIDAALLRPGRLDRHILCGLPTAAERGDVLRKLAQRLRVEPGVDAGRAAAGLEGCTGADLQALAHDAQLRAVHRLIDAPEPAAAAGGSGGGGGAAVRWEDLERAAAELRPSLSAAERAKYDAINRAFSQAHAQEDSDGSGSGPAALGVLVDANEPGRPGQSLRARVVGRLATLA